MVCLKSAKTMLALNILYYMILYAYKTMLVISVAIHDIATHRSLEKIRREKISSRTPRTTKIKHMKIFLPQRNRVVYNDL